MIYLQQLHKEEVVFGQSNVPFSIRLKNIISQAILNTKSLRFHQGEGGECLTSSVDVRLLGDKHVLGISGINFFLFLVFVLITEIGDNTPNHTALRPFQRNNYPI